eukprot:GEMP01047471.1.p2 GENE.GEMP01047471.1~~GEMP01047471.1.p2  ORF type:complete len:166 (+),score=50.33 GEMP01047471.1:123-620(+)
MAQASPPMVVGSPQPQYAPPPMEYQGQEQRDGHGEVPTAQAVGVPGAPQVAPAPGQYGAPEQQQHGVPVQQQIGAPGPQQYGAPAPQQYAAPMPVAQGPTLQCGHCHNLFVTPPNVGSGKSNENLCLAAVLCIIGCWPCALCIFCSDDSTTSVNCPTCGKENRLR